jgi:hypothetical protein
LLIEGGKRRGKGAALLIQLDATHTQQQHAASAAAVLESHVNKRFRLSAQD